MSQQTPEHEKFELVSTPRRTGVRRELRGKVPGEEADLKKRIRIPVALSTGGEPRQILLTEKLAQGGEGSVFATDVDGHVAKIYHREKLTEDRYQKIRTMLNKPVRKAGICFPVGLISNDHGDWVGYLMPEAKGVELARSVFIPQLLPRKFPDWTRKDTIQLCISILHMIKYLNDRHVIIGDINASNILVESPKDVYFVDCDSYQIEGYPCTVGTAHFTPPEVSGKDFSTFLRTQEMENFAVATLLFMIMLPGKPPYSAVGGTTPAQNIREGNFPYEGDDSSLPPGKWGFIWNHMAYRTRRAFLETFKRGEPHFLPPNRHSTGAWLGHFVAYRRSVDKMLKNDPMALDLFPNRRKMKECAEESCQTRFVPTEENLFLFCDEHLVTSPRRRPDREDQAHRNQGFDNAPLRTSHCKNPRCGKAFTARQNRRDEYCQDCWQEAWCTQCGYSAKKWMHDERGGLCRKCFGRQDASSAAAKPSSKIAAPSTRPKPQKENGCFVATAVYGSYDCPEVWVLRRWRDRTLLATKHGRIFVSLYYAVSPSLVRLIGNKKWLLTPTEKLLSRLICTLEQEGISNSPYRDPTIV